MFTYKICIFIKNRCAGSSPHNPVNLYIVWRPQVFFLKDPISLFFYFIREVNNHYRKPAPYLLLTRTIVKEDTCTCKNWHMVYSRKTPILISKGGWESKVQCLVQGHFGVWLGGSRKWSLTLFIDGCLTSQLHCIQFPVQEDFDMWSPTFVRGCLMRSGFCL